MNAYIKNGWDKQLVDPERSHQSPGEQLAPLLPSDGWQEITGAFSSAQQAIPFTNAQIITYFITRTVDDSLPAGDFRSINKSGCNLYRCGHVQKIEVCHASSSDKVYIRADCLPEMRKDRVYKIILKLDSGSYEIDGAECGCPAGRGPRASCKHIAALCYALEEFARLKQLPSFQTSTERLQTWNQPRPRKFQPIPVESMRARMHEIMPPSIRPLQQTRVASHFDPRPEGMRVLGPTASETLRCSLLGLNKPCGFLHVLVPDVVKIEHDHTYCSKRTTTTDAPSPSILATSTDDHVNYRTRELSSDEIAIRKKSFNVSTALQHSIEERTRKQFQTEEWHRLRVQRITSSTCGLILTQKKKTVALLRQCLYSKPLLHPLPLPIAWGRENEQIACRKYEEFMVRNGHSGLTTSPCGFIIHPEKSWLGASPDAKVFDPSSNLQNGIAEFKCPYSKRDKSPQEACSDQGFFCEMVNGKFSLKRNHQYYHQVQLQLYVATTRASWCDFCVYTPVGIATERIYPCSEWKSSHIPQLEEYFDTHMLPEIACPLYKPSYIL